MKEVEEVALRSPVAHGDVYSCRRVLLRTGVSASVLLVSRSCVDTGCQLKENLGHV